MSTTGVGLSTDKGKASKPSRKVVPNHFVAIQIKNPKIHEQVARVQQMILTQNQALEKAIIALPTLHITLAVMQFDAEDDEVIGRTANAMDEALAKIRPNLTDEPLNFVLRGIDHFSNKVLFAQVDGKETVDRMIWISKIVKEAFATNGVAVTDEELKAHLTIMKLSNLSFKERKIVRKIDPTLYAEMLDCEFGDETVTSLQLLAMNVPKDANGYYHCVKQVFIND